MAGGSTIVCVVRNIGLFMRCLYIGMPVGVAGLAGSAAAGSNTFVDCCFDAGIGALVTGIAGNGASR